MTRPLSIVLSVAVLILLSVSPAVAQDKIGLSLDGTSFGPSLPAPLFDPDTRWVPGDTRSASFYVRNQADESAELSVDILGTQVDSLLETGDLTISARGGGGAWHEVSTTGTQRLVSNLGIGSGARQKVDVTVAFAASSINTSQNTQLELDFRVLLTQDTAAASPNGDDGDGILPDTGAPALWFVILGLTFVTVGINLVRKRREKEDSHV